MQVYLDRSARPHQLRGASVMQGGVVQHATVHQVNPPRITVQRTSQNVNAIPMMMQTTTDDSTNQVFPVRTFKIFGCVQIGLGVILCILSVIGAVLDGIRMNKKDCSDDIYPYNGYLSDCHYRYYYYYSYRYWSHTLFAYDITCLILSGWFICTGFIPICMSRKRRNSWRCLKIAFMVCSIIGASLFVPVVFSLGVVGSFRREFYSNEISQTTAVSALTAVLAFLEVVFAIASASYCCCCTAWETSSPSQNFIYVGGNNPQIIMVPQTQRQGINMQPVVLTTTQQQYAARQHQPNVLLNEATGGNASMDLPPPYKE